MVPGFTKILRRDQEIIGFGESKANNEVPSNTQMPFVYPEEPDVLQLPKIFEVLPDMFTKDGHKSDNE